MKKLNKLSVLLLCCLGMFSMSSCLNSDDDGGIDPQLYETYLTNISGLYYGTGTDWRHQNKIYFYNDTITADTPSEKVDSVGGITVAFMKNDSSFVVDNVPGRVLAKEITDDKYKDLKAAIENGPTQTLRGKFYFTNISQYAYFLVYPSTVEYKDLAYGGETHDVVIDFWTPVATGIYGYVGGKQVVNLTLYLAALYIDGKKAFDIYNGTDVGVEQMKAQLLISAAR